MSSKVAEVREDFQVLVSRTEEQGPLNQIELYAVPSVTAEYKGVANIWLNLTIHESRRLRHALEEAERKLES